LRAKPTQPVMPKGIDVRFAKARKLKVALEGASTIGLILRLMERGAVRATILLNLTNRFLEAC
jgi:hypothetical protein